MFLRNDIIQNIVEFINMEIEKIKKKITIVRETKKVQ